MPLDPGSRLGAYEIASLLGRGGMGEVYRARDSRLGREVAIKVLPEALVDPDRLARFQREAQLLAALNHSNIAAIYGVEETAGVHALILEMVEGPTLADRIAVGPLPLDEALPIARQIADALETAHEQGIIHRDLKPANIKVRPDGTVKVLDFGLAKIVETGSPSSSATGVSQSPTLTSPALTRLGLILGTAAYMAPEQAKGQPADRRSDIWAFGCVLFEMLSGKRAFGGDDVADTLAAVLRAEPDWAALPGDALLIRPLLERCLRKDSRKRLPHIGAARLELDDAMARFGNNEQPVAIPSGERGSRSRSGWVAAALAIALAGALAIPAVTHWRETAAEVPGEMRLEIATPPSGAPNSFAISPDGRQLVYSVLADGVSQLWVRSLDGTSARPLPGTTGARDPFWSPDGRSVGFFAESALKRIDLSGGSSRALAPAIPGLGGSWNADGVILYGSGTIGPLQRVSASGGTATVATALDDGDSVHSFPSFLPDQRHFLVFVGGKRPGLHIGSLGSLRTEWLTDADSGGAFMAPEWLLFVRSAALVAQRFDPVNRKIVGDPIVVADPVNVTRVPASDVPFSISSTGVLMYRGRGTVRRQLVWVDRSGKKTAEATAALDGDLVNPEIALDGRIVVEQSRGNNKDIWVIDGQRRMRRVTTHVARDAFPTWSPDGSRIFYGSERTGRLLIHETRSDGSGTDAPLPSPAVGAVPAHVSRDGRFLAYLSLDPTTREDVGVLPLIGDSTPRLVANTEFTELWGQFSPDGNWIAYQSNESGSMQVYLRPYPGPGGQWPVSTTGGIHVRWAPDGKELYYVAPDGRLMAVAVAFKGPAPELATPVPLFDANLINGGLSIIGLRQQYDVARDGRFLLNVTADGGAMPPITVVLNWGPVHHQ